MSQVAMHATTTDVDYRGETAPRQRWLAVLLTYLCPGLGYMYIGHVLKGITVNLLFVLLLEAFVIVLSILKFFPLMPIGVLVLAWFVFSTLVAAHVLELMARAQHQEPEYVLKNYNHWVLYCVVFLLSYVTPISVTTHFTARYLWSVAPMHTAAMYPAVEPGDTLIIDRMVYRKEPLKRGDLVAIRAPQGDETLVLRVVAVPDDIVRIEGMNLYLNDEAVQSFPLEPENVQQGFVARDDMYVWVEHNHSERYVISLAPRMMHSMVLAPTRIEDGQVFLLSDNRSQVPIYKEPGTIRDSRLFGAIDVDMIEGKPLYIGWSVHPVTNAVRWERIGLRTQ
ncbi:MAG: signal peptidase I [Bradymonadaceae bacterium]|nr:signal peptidase I [Lujinxingiaceae bacterium]